MTVARTIRKLASSSALAALLVFPPGCSSDATSPGSTADAQVVDDDTTSDAGTDAAEADATDGIDATDAIDAPHNCPGCQATKCAAELKACGGSSTCVDWLLCMNECFKKTDVASCQTRCRATMDAAAKKMDACTEANCHTDCTP